MEISAMLKSFLKTENYEVIAVSDGESALGFYEILSQKDFEVELSIPERAVYAQGDKDALQRIPETGRSRGTAWGLRLQKILPSSWVATFV